MTLDQRVLDHAETQHGLITRQQLQAFGASSAAIRHRTTNGSWSALSPQVLRLAGAPQTPRQAAMAAVLDAGSGSWLSHESGAAMWEQPGFDLAPAQVSRPRTGTRRTGRLGVLHYPGRVLPSHITALDGIPVSTPTRVLFELAGRIHPKRLERLLDNTWSSGLVDHQSLSRSFAVLAGRGRPGIAAMRKLLEERGPDYRPAESGLERRVEQILADDGQQALERQVDLGDEVGWIGRVDLFDREARVVVEVNSDRFHGALVDRRADKRRRQRLEAAGFTVVEIWESDIWYRPSHVASTVRDARRLGRYLRRNPHVTSS